MESFADDTAVIFNAEPWNELKSLTEEEINNIINFFKDELWTLNFIKTHVVPVTTYQRCLPEFDELVIRSNCGCQYGTYLL